MVLYMQRIFCGGLGGSLSNPSVCWGWVVERSLSLYLRAISLTVEGAAHEMSTGGRSVQQTEMASCTGLLRNSLISCWFTGAPVGVHAGTREGKRGRQRGTRWGCEGGGDSSGKGWNTP